MSKWTGLSREEMEAVIDGGGSILYMGAVISDKSQLPTSAQLAGTDPDSIAKVEADLDAKQKEIDDQRAQMKAARAKAEAEAEAEAEAASASNPSPEAHSEKQASSAPKGK